MNAPQPAKERRHQTPFQPLDDHTVASVLALKPTLAEVEEAAASSAGAGDVFTGGRPSRGIVEAIVELVGMEDEEFGEDR